MKGYVKYAFTMAKHIERYEGEEEAHLIEVATLKVRMPGEGIVAIDQTPHYQYTLGNTQPYKDWLVAHDHLYESSLASFEHLMNDDSLYLDGKHRQDFIMHDDDLVIIDGVHRATRLFQLGVKYAPVLRKIT